MHTRHVLTLPLLLMTLGIDRVFADAGPPVADATLSSTQVHGFLTAGAAINDQAHVAELRDLGDNLGIPHRGDYWAPDSRLGIQWDQQLSHRLAATVQVVAAHQVAQTFNNSVQWAFLRYNWTSAWTLRLGRTGVDAFMLSDHRNVGYSYLWVRPPVEFYGYLPLYSEDGADLQYEHQLGDGLLMVKVFGGTSRPFFYIKTAPPPSYTQFLMSPIVGLNIVWKNPDWTLRAGGVSLKMHHDFSGMDTLLNAASALAPYYPPFATAATVGSEDNTHITYWGTGANYDDGQWVVLSEFSSTLFQSQFKANTAEAYLTLGMHLEDWTPFINYSRVWETRTDYQVPLPPGALLQSYPAPLAQSVSALTTGFNKGLFGLTESRQATWSLGVRWDFANNMDLKAQYDLVRVAPNAFDLWTNTPGFAPRQGNVSMLSLTFDTVF